MKKNLSNCTIAKMEFKRGKISPFSVGRPRIALKSIFRLKHNFSSYMLPYPPQNAPRVGYLPDAFRLRSCPLQARSQAIPLHKKEAMNPLTQTILTFVLGGGLVSFLTAIITMKYTKKQAEANAMKAMQDVYQELITDLRVDITDMRAERKELRSEVDKVKSEVDNNRKLYNELKPYKCTDLSCIHRKS